MPLQIWQDFDDTAEQVEAEPEDDGAVPKTEYQDVIISDVRTGAGLTFSIQILNTEGIASLETLMRDFSLYHKTAATAAAFTPKSGDLVSAKFSDGAWYRARVRRASPVKKEAEVTFIDYGNQSTVGFNEIRPLDPRFRSLPGQAHDARLRYVFRRCVVIRTELTWTQFHQTPRSVERVLSRGRRSLPPAV